MKRQQVADWTKRLAYLCEEGVPLMRALEMACTNENGMAVIAADLKEMYATGATFAEATAARPNLFDKAYVNMAKCGEVAGVLDVVLHRLHDYILDEMKFATDLYLYKLSTMMLAGVPVLQALWIARDGLSISEDLAPLHELVKEGENLSTGMEQCGLFTEEQINIVKHSETSGDGIAFIARNVRSLIST